MPVNIDDVIQKMSPEQRRKVDARAAELMAEEMTLQGLRMARQLTQVRLAKLLGVSQDRVSRMEKGGDFLLSTLQKTVTAMGGELSLVARFPDHMPVVISTGEPENVRATGTADGVVRVKPATGKRAAIMKKNAARRDSHKRAVPLRA